MTRVKKESKSKEIANFIRESGFVLELEVADFLEKNGYKVDQSQYFFDAEEEKKREIDLIARKNINGISVCLVIECKQNLGDDWIFISTQKDPTRHFAELKHAPEIPTKVLQENKPYDDLHIYNFKTPLAQSYLVYRREKGKKTKVEPLQITECIHKLPKALVWVARDGANTPTIYFPVALFSGSIFVANHKSKLIVKERMLVQIQTTLESSAYYDKPTFSSSPPVVASEVKPDLITDPDMRKVKISAKRLGKEYTIDFINKKGLKHYLTVIEKEVGLLDISKWPLPTPKS